MAAEAEIVASHSDLLDTPSSRLEVVLSESLKRWSRITPRDFSESDVIGASGNKVHDVSPFPVNQKINSKIALFAGDITLLDCEAIVNTTNESFSDRSPISARIYQKAGPAMRMYLKETLKFCRTGEAKISKGYNLPARFVIHTVGPKYNDKYHTAAESALHSSYLKVLQVARDNRIRTLALCPINSVRRGYPPHDGAHMALRVVRKCLNKFADDFELIVFAVEDVDIGIYDHLMPLYFPRSEQEEEYSTFYLPEDVGGVNGEPVIPERQIRISNKPVVNDFDNTVDLSSGLESSVVVGKTSFAKMQPDVDRRWTLTRTENSSRRPSTDPVTREVQRRNRYARIIRTGKNEDFSDMERLRFVYVAGDDVHGRTVIVIIGHRLPFTSVDPSRILNYALTTLDPIITKRKYIIVYFHSLTSSRNNPGLSFTRDALDLLEPSSLLNLCAVYVVHPTLWCRLISWWFTTFSESTMKDKICYLGGVEHLKSLIPLEQLQIPSQIMDHDFKVSQELCSFTCTRSSLHAAISEREVTFIRRWSNFLFPSKITCRLYKCLRETRHTHTFIPQNGENINGMSNRQSKTKSAQRK
jgi:O-acetyl-ADP-ribose deacetylase (regulator of RNase III)